MSECEVTKKLRFSFNDRVYFLSSNKLRIESGTVIEARIRGEVDLQSKKFYGGSSVVYYVRQTSANRSTVHYFEDSKVFATKEEARAYRKADLNVQFDQLSSSIRNYLQCVMQLPKSELEAHRKERFEQFKELWEEIK